MSPCQAAYKSLLERGERIRAERAIGRCFPLFDQTKPIRSVRDHGRIEPPAPTTSCRHRKKAATSIKRRDSVMRIAPLDRCDCYLHHTKLGSMSAADENQSGDSVRTGIVEQDRPS